MRITTILALVAVATRAHALVLCTTPDGKTYAGDFPPEGCSVSRKYEAEAPRDSGDGGKSVDESTGEDTLDAQAITARRRIEDRVNRIAEDLEKVSAQIASVPYISPSEYRTSDEYVQALHQRSAILSELHDQRTNLKIAMDAAVSDFKTLTAEFSRARGGLPSWWGPIRCARCS